MVDQLPGFAVSGFTLLGFWFAGKRQRLGWMVAAISEVLWLPYCVWLHQYGLLVTCLVFLGVYVRNWWRWKPEDPEGERLVRTYLEALAQEDRWPVVLHEPHVPTVTWSEGYAFRVKASDLFESRPSAWDQHVEHLRQSGAVRGPSADLIIIDDPIDERWLRDPGAAKRAADWWFELKERHEGPAQVPEARLPAAGVAGQRLLLRALLARRRRPPRDRGPQHGV